MRNYEFTTATIKSASNLPRLVRAFGRIPAEAVRREVAVHDHEDREEDSVEGRAAVRPELLPAHSDQRADVVRPGHWAQRTDPEVRPSPVTLFLVEGGKFDAKSVVHTGL